MRILHTADWHVGRTIRGRSRADEHAAVLGEIAGVAAREQVDLTLVAGDVFDHAAPSPGAERIVYRALLDLAASAPVVLVAGNHDHPGRLAAVAPLLAGVEVHVAAQIARPDAGGVADVETRSREVARIALLPFVSKRGIVRAADLIAADAYEHEQAYAARLGAVIETLCAGFGGDTVNLLLGHLMTVGAAAGGGERAAHTVMEYAVPATVFPASAHYAALGHLHHPQQVPASCPAWYAGSPLQLDFGEERDDKAVLVVEAAPGRPAEVRRVPLASGRRLRTLRGTLAELEAQVGAAGEDYLRVVVRGEARAGLAEQVREWFPEAVDVIVERPERPERGDADGPARLGRSPAELFGEYLVERGASDERVLALFRELLDEASTAEAG